MSVLPSNREVPAARIDRVDMQYLYEDGDLYNFMNVENYEQLALNKDIIGDALKFVKEKRDLQGLFLQRQRILCRASSVC